MIDQNTTMQEGDRVRLLVDLMEYPSGSLGTVQRGFAGLLGVRFDNDADFIHLEDTGQGYTVNLCEKL